MDQGDRSLPEIARRLDEVFARFDKIVSDLPRTFVSRELFNGREELHASEHARIQQTIEDRRALVDLQLDEQKRRIEELESDKAWLYRLVIGAVVLALVGLAIGFAHTAVQPGAKPGTGQVSGK